MSRIKHFGSAYPDRSRGVPSLTKFSGTQANAVQNTWYPLVSMRNVCLLGWGIGVTTNDETLEARITIDGMTIGAAAGGVAVTAGQFSKFNSIRYTAIATPTLLMAATGANIDYLYTDSGPVMGIKGKSILIEVRKTTATGANSGLVCNGFYEQY